MKFKLVGNFSPAGSQPQAIEKLNAGVTKFSQQTLLGITGSGKTFIIANTIAHYNKPTLVLAHNKTLAAQLYQEFKELFPENAVEYFISYYDYYQPESYIPTSDTYIEKSASINEEIDKLRLKAVTSLLSRNDVIVVASVSCIYGLSNPQDFRELSFTLKVGEEISRSKLLKQLVTMQYQRNKLTLEPATFLVQGETVEIFLPYNELVLQVQFFGDEIEELQFIDPVSKQVYQQLEQITIFPAKQYVVPEHKHAQALEAIKKELEEWAPQLPPLESERIQKRVKYDLEMIEEVGYCTGIENYSRHFDDRSPGDSPYVLLDFFPEDFLFVIDESHQTLPQLNAMYKGDYSRKNNLVEHGFRLPCAYDNRPLQFKEVERYFKHVVYVSATPGPYELKNSQQVVESIIRPTGLLDPLIEIRPVKDQITNVFHEITAAVKKKQRVLITTLTKRMAERLTDFLASEGVKVRYMHSDIASLDRIEIVRQLRLGEFNVLVGINLLREGLDIPEVGLVVILDADKEGFLRDERSLVQTIGRAARNSEGKVILYADKITKSIHAAVTLTKSRRATQHAFNLKHNITPQTVFKKIPESVRQVEPVNHLTRKQLLHKQKQLYQDMKLAAKNYEFERAIELREQTKEIMKRLEYLESQEK